MIPASAKKKKRREIRLRDSGELGPLRHPPNAFFGSRLTNHKVAATGTERCAVNNNLPRENVTLSNGKLDLRVMGKTT